jgi:diketogulonate reductase-like aldo/keto reductase
MTKVALVTVVLQLCCSMLIVRGLLDDSKTVYVSNEIQMPRIGFGTAALGSRVKEMTCTAIKAGIKLIDSAQAVEWYREGSVGEAIRECHDDSTGSQLVVVTKIHPRSYM